MHFTSPEWFLLIPAVLFIGWFWKRLRIYSPLRLILVVLAAFTLADPRMTLRDDSLDLWVLLDRSDSTEDLVDLGLSEWERLLEKSKPSRRDRMILRAFTDRITGSHHLAPAHSAAGDQGRQHQTKKNPEPLVRHLPLASELLHQELLFQFLDSVIMDESVI